MGVNVKNKAAREFAVTAARIAFDRNCKDITVLNLEAQSPATDYFVIATGTSDRQARSVADEINEAAAERGFERFGRAGYQQGQWILMDYVDAVVHIFSEEFRGYYDLELLWGDSERVEID
jgi:ribosome-associated protein